MDSPGFNANFCTYDLMNNAELGILDVVVIDKKEVGLKSTKMEKGFVMGLKSLQKDGVNVVEISTDAHSQITKLASMSFLLFSFLFRISLYKYYCPVFCDITMVVCPYNLPRWDNFRSGDLIL